MISAAAASHPDLAAAHRHGLDPFTALVAGFIDAGRGCGEVPQSVSSSQAVGALVAFVDGLTLRGIVKLGGDLVGVLGHAVDALLR